MGDLVATCTSRHSRNRAAGELLAARRAAHRVEGTIGMVVEGLATAPALRRLAARARRRPADHRGRLRLVDGMPLARCDLRALLERVPTDEFTGGAGGERAPIV